MESNINKKFTTLRQNLDDMRFYQTLHPDSLDLVDNLFNALKKVSVSYHNLKKSMSSQSVSEIGSRSQVYIRGQNSNNTSIANRSEDLTSNNDHKMNMLLKQLQQTKKKLELREQELQLLVNARIKEIREKYDSKIDEYLKQIQKLQKREEDGNKQKKLMQECIETLQRELDDVRDQLGNKQRILVNETKQRIAIRRQYDDVLNTTESQDNRASLELKVILQRKSIRIQQLQELDIMNKAKLTDLKKQVQIAQDKQKHIQNLNKSLNGVIESLKEQNSDLDRTISRMNLNIEQVNREIETSKRCRNSLQQQLQKFKQSQFEGNLKIQTRQKDKEKLSILYEDINKSLQQKKNQCETLSVQKQELQRIVEGLQKKMKQISNKNVVLNNNINSLQDELNIIKSRYTQKLKELKEIQVQKLQLERISKQAQPTLLKYYDLEAKYNQLLGSGETSNDIQRKSRQEYQLHIKTLEQELSIMKERQQQSIIKTQKFSNEAKRLETFLEHGNKQIDTVNSQKEALIKENKQLREQLSSVSQKAYSNKTQGIKQVEKINSNQILIHDLKNTLNSQNHKVRLLQDHNKLLETNVKKCEEKNRQLYQDNVQLKAMCQGLQHNKNQLWGKLKRNTSDRELVQSEKVKKSQQYIQLKKQLQRCQQEIEEKQRAILNIDGIRDSYQSQFNQAAQQNQEMKKRIKKLQQDLRRNDQSLGETQLSLHGYEVHINTLQNQRDNFMKRNQKTEAELGKLKAAFTKLKNESMMQENDAGYLTASNKDWSKKYQTLLGSYNSLNQKLQDSVIQIDESRTNLHVIKLQNQEVSNNCLHLSNQVRRLEGLIRELQAQNHSMFDHLHTKDAQLQDLKQRLIQSEYKQAGYLGQISSYQKQRTILSNQLNLKDEYLRQTTMDRDFLKSEVSISRRQPQIDWKSIMEERLMHTQCQLDLKKREVESHVIENRKLNKVIEEERMINFKLSKQMQEMRYNSHLGTPIRNLMAESMDQSQTQNSSIHSNRIEIDRPMQSFQSNNTINSKNISDKFEEIREKYLITVNGVQNLKSKRS